MIIRTALDSVLSVIYPQECRLCSGSVEKLSDGVVCSNCWDDAVLFNGSETLCAKCGNYLSERPSNFEAFCSHCVDHWYDATAAAGLYRGALAVSVLKLKNRAELPHRLRCALIDAAQKMEVPSNSVILPVPLSRQRLRERGFNQAAFLASIVSKELKVQIDERSLVRIVHTERHRAAMDRKARDVTVKNAFAVVRPKLIKDRDILLVDDVMTSGATASYCAKVLKKSGAASVRVLTLARAV